MTPHSGYPEEDIERTTQEFSEFLNKIPTNNTTIIIGADLNASIGTRMTEAPQTNDQEDNDFNPQEDNIMELLGPHGNPHRNENGERILNLMREHDLRAASTFFDCNNKHNTWRNPKDKRPHQIDHLLIPRNQLCLTTNVKRKLDSIDSDHAALCIEFLLPNGTILRTKDKEKNEVTRPKTRINNFILRNSQKGEFQNNVSNFFQNLDPQKIIDASNDDLLLLFEKHIVNAAKEAAE